MGEYIEREALLKALEAGHYDGSITGPEDVEKLVHNAPAVKPTDLVPKGRWNGEGDGYADGEIVLDVWYCSECNHCIDDGTDEPALLPKFCPNCGAKMEE